MSEKIGELKRWLLRETVKHKITWSDAILW